MGIESFTIVDDVLSPNDKLMIEYKGPNPFKLYGKVNALMQVIFHGRGKNVSEEKFKWDITGDPKDFYSFFRWIDDKFDKFTKPEYSILGLGRQPSDPNAPNGAIYIEIKAKLTTEYKFGPKERDISSIEKALATSFIWTYHRLLYSAVRRRYLQIMKERTYKFAEAIRKELGVPFEMPELSGADVRVSKLPV